MKAEPVILVTDDIEPFLSNLDIAIEGLPSLHFKVVPISEVPKLCQDDSSIHALVTGEKLISGPIMEAIQALENEVPIVVADMSTTQAQLEHGLINAIELARERRRVRLIARLTSQIHQANSTAEVMRVTCQVAVELFGIDHSGFVEFDDSGQHGWKVSEYPKMSEARDYIQVAGILAEEQVVRQGEIFISTDIEKDGRLGSVGTHLLEKGIRSILIAPVKAGQRVIGSFSLDAISQPREFLRDEIGLAKQLANQAGIALHNLRQREAADGLRSSLRALHKIAKRSVQGNLKATLQDIVDLAHEELKADNATLYTYDSEQERFLLDVGRGDHPGSRARPSNLSRESTLYRILGLNEDLPYEKTEDAPNHPTFRGGFVDKEKVISSFGMKLCYQDEPVGVLFINYRSVHHFKDEELETFQQFGHQAAVLIKTAWLKDQLSKKLAALEGLYESGITDSGDPNLEHALSRIAAQALTAVGLNHENGVSHIAIASRGRLRFVAASSAEVLDGLRNNIREIDLVNPVGKIGIAGRTFLNGENCNVGQTWNHVDYIEYRPELKSQISVLLKVGGRKLGVLSVESANEYAFSSDEVKNLEHLAEHADMVIQSSRHMMLLDGLIASGNAVNDGRNIWQSLQSIANLVETTFDCDLVSIYPYDSKKNEIIYPAIVSGEIMVPELRNNPRLKPRHGRIRADKLIEGSVLKTMLSEKMNVFCEQDADNHPILGKGGFTKREKIEASAAIRLLTGDGALAGLVFLNYRQSHEFQIMEKKEINIFAHYLAQVFEHYSSYEAIRQQKGIVGMMNAYQWMNKLSERDAQAREEVRDLLGTLSLVQQSLRTTSGLDRDGDLIALLEKSRKNAQRLKQHLEAPLKMESKDVAIESLIRDHLETGLEQLEQNLIQVELGGLEPAQVRVDPDWLRHGLNQILLHIQETGGAEPIINVLVETLIQDSHVSILLTHAGYCDVPGEGTGLDFIHWESSESSPTHLMMADAIFRLFDGSLDRKITREGTTFQVLLPISTEEMTYTATVV